jgi:hypothetical protein
VQVLPWLLVSEGPLQPPDLAQLATTRALSALLELRLGVTTGACDVRDRLACDTLGVVARRVRPGTRHLQT